MPLEVFLVIIFLFSFFFFSFFLSNVLRKVIQNQLNIQRPVYQNKYNLNTAGVKYGPLLKKIHDIYFTKYRTWKADIAETIIAINYFRPILQLRSWQDSEYVLGSEYTKVWICQRYTGFWICLNTPKWFLNMPQYTWVCLNMSEF